MALCPGPTAPGTRNTATIPLLSASGPPLGALANGDLQRRGYDERGRGPIMSRLDAHPSFVHIERVSELKLGLPINEFEEAIPCLCNPTVQNLAVHCDWWFDKVSLPPNVLGGYFTSLKLLRLLGAPINFQFPHGFPQMRHFELSVVTIREGFTDATLDTLEQMPSPETLVNQANYHLTLWESPHAIRPPCALFAGCTESGHTCQSTRVRCSFPRPSPFNCQNLSKCKRFPYTLTKIAEHGFGLMDQMNRN